MTKPVMTTLAKASGAGLMMSAEWLGVVPGWVIIVVVVVGAVVLLVREVVSQLIRVRASLVDPVGTHGVETVVMPQCGYGKQVDVGASRRGARGSRRSGRGKSGKGRGG